MKAKFTACATGVPEPTAEWFKDGDKLYPSERIRIDAESTGLLRLSINDCTERDVGRYSCRVFNPHGEDTCHSDMTYDSEFCFDF